MSDTVYETVCHTPRRTGIVSETKYRVDPEYSDSQISSTPSASGAYTSKQNRAEPGYSVHGTSVSIFWHSDTPGQRCVDV